MSYLLLSKNGRGEVYSNLEQNSIYNNSGIPERSIIHSMYTIPSLKSG